LSDLHSDEQRYIALNSGSVRPVGGALSMLYAVAAVAVIVGMSATTFMAWRTVHREHCEVVMVDAMMPGNRADIGDCLAGLNAVQRTQWEQNRRILNR
jgi:hypothetical protein